jgi:hypothetical protein
LSPDWQAVTVPETTIAPNLSEALDVKINRFPQLTLNHMLPLNKFSDTVDFLFGKVIHLHILIDASLS